MSLIDDNANSIAISNKSDVTRRL